MSEEKNELRAHALDHLSRIRPEDENIEHSARLFQDHVPMKKGDVVALYWPKGNEFDVRYIIDDLLAQGIRIALPVCRTDTKIMDFCEWDGKGDLVKGAYGVYVPPEEKPVAPDILVVPMLAFDRKGNRLGRGAGHYDATIAALKQKKKDILTVGAAYASQAVLFNLPAEPHDQPMDMILTQQGVQDFRKQDS